MNLKRPSKAKKVAVVGPESTGKSSLSEFLASHFKTNWVPEYARGYLDNLTRPYQQHDLLTIARGQIRLEDKYAYDSQDLLICDTNLYVIKVWSQYKYGTCHPEILNHIATRKYDLYLLTYIDLPWIPDPLREHPEKREELFNIYLNELKRQSVPCVVIKGQGEQRQRAAVKAIEKLVLGK